MIDLQDKVFHLKGETYSYLLRVNDFGQPEQLHFGAPVRTEDFAAFLCRPGLGWGGSVLLRKGDTASCPDDKPLEWSGSGRGDYRESPLELAGSPTDLRFSCAEVVKTPPMESPLPQSHGAEESLKLTLSQRGLRVTLYYTPFETALTRRCVVENTSDTPVTLGKCMSYMVDIPGEFVLRSFHGGWIAEAHRRDTPVGEAKVVLESLTGASSNRCNPGFLLYEPDAAEDAGRVYGFNLIYSGSHYASAQRSLQGLTRVMQGVQPSNFRKTLAPGERFETPEAVLCCADHGFGELSRRMHRFVTDHVIPPYWRERPRPVLYNSWEGCGFRFSQRSLLDLAARAKKLGCELFVLDDGWFGARDNDQAGLGDYTVNRRKLPGGLEGLAAKLNELGMDFGLWFEPESVNPDSELYRAHPDWVLRDEFEPVYGRNQLHLDLTRPEVRDYIVENVTRILDSVPIRYVKWDMNRHSIALGARAHENVLGLYEVLRRIFTPRPEILLESCSSGGNRFDLGMLTFSPQIWCSDDTDPIERLDIQEGLSYLYPQSTFGAHVSAAPHAQTLRNTPLATRGNVSFFGCLGYELDLKPLLPVERQEIQAQIAFYKQYRQVFQFGALRRTPTGWQVSDGKTTLCGVFHRLISAAPGYERLRVWGLEPEKRYRVASLEQRIRVGQFGGLLKHVAPVNVNPNGALLRAADARYTLKVPSEERFLSGAALMAGMVLRPLFRGTGYEETQRTQADFGSDIYIIEEAE